jgi:hypothetical protein
MMLNDRQPSIDQRRGSRGDSQRRAHFVVRASACDFYSPVSFTSCSPLPFRSPVSGFSFFFTPLPANPVLLSRMLSEPKIQNFSSFRLHPSNKCAQIAKEWLDKGLAKCHEIAVLHPSSRNPPAWIGKIHGITFFTPTGTPPSSSATTRHQLLVTRHSGSAAIHHSPSKIQHSSHSNIQNPSSSASIACFSINRAKGLERRAIILTGLPAWEECAKNDYQSRTFVLGATCAQQLLAACNFRIKI